MSKEKEFFLKEFMICLTDFVDNSSGKCITVSGTVFRRTISFIKENIYNNNNKRGVYKIIVKDKNDGHQISYFGNIQTPLAAVEILSNEIEKAIKDIEL